LKTGVEIGNGDEGLAAYIKGGHKAIKKKPHFAFFQRFIVHGLNITPFGGFGKARQGRAYVPLYGASSGLAFGGRPLPGTLRMASKAEGSYTASFDMGFIFATNKRCITVLGAMPNISAISDIVSPSIHIISEYLSKKLDFLQILNICVVKIHKNSNFFLRFILT
jgi:hypothetical protein